MNCDEEKAETVAVIDMLQSARLFQVTHCPYPNDRAFYPY